MWHGSVITGTLEPQSRNASRVLGRAQRGDTMAMSDSMHRRCAQTMVSLALSAADSHVAGAQRSIDGNSVCAEMVYVIANDCDVRNRLLDDLTLRGIDVRCFASADEYLQCPRGCAVACIIAELQPGGAAGHELQRQVREEGGPPIIFIGTHLDMLTGIRAMKAGAHDFLVRPVMPEELYGAVKEALRHDRISRQRQGEIAGLKASYSSLTRREREVFALVVQGFLNKQVAGILAISLVTVQIHRGNTMRKMGARSFADLVCMALKLRILEKDLTYPMNSGFHYQKPEAISVP